MESQEWWNRTAAAGKRVVEVAAAIGIGFLFLVVVMIATAQQDVVSRMKAEQLSMGYNSALLVRMRANQKAEAIPGLELREREALAKVRNSEAALAQEQRDFDLAWEEFEPLAARLSRTGACDIAVAGDATARARAVTANQVLQCVPEGGTGPGTMRLLQQARDAARQFVGVLQQFVRAQDALNGANAQLAGVREQLQASRTLSDDEQKALRSFSDMDVLLQPWMVGASFLVQFPPALLQILLTFTSGLFGALLVTLVLIVYPKNLVAGSAGAHAATRTFLGGLIALCVYIVLLSGAAVLGSGTSAEGAGSNYMAFTGIGILAGMFSDRVAGWLSKQADTFFRQ